VGGRSSGNTRRLYELARQTGKPAFHIETEKDLDDIDLDMLSSCESIGITAGASTPNWIIKKVYRSLENLLFNRRQGWKRVLFSLMRVGLLTNLYVSLGAGCLCFACIRLLGIPQYLPYVLISFLYVQSMHLLNHLVGSEADRYNDPDRASFYQKYKWLLTASTITAGAGGLVLAYFQGLFPFLALLVMSMMGFSYNINLVPKQMSRIVYRRIRDIPGSKTLLIAMAWGTVTAVLPALGTTASLTWSTVVVFLWSAGLVFVRTAFFDILDMQGDRIMGKETIPILLGEAKSMRLLKRMLMLLTVVMVLAASGGAVRPQGFLLALCPLVILLLLTAYEKGGMLPGIRLEFLMESQFVLVGALVLAGSFWS
jgi:4-hydroxy-3-methylbut-2-enyl diphosphate reductase